MRAPPLHFFRARGHAASREIVLTLTDFVGEYNDKPGAVPAGPDIVPVYSDDGEQWQHFPGAQWDNIKKEIVVPAYIKDVAKVQIYCAWAEAVLGEASFSSPVK